MPAPSRGMQATMSPLETLLQQGLAFDCRRAEGDTGHQMTGCLGRTCFPSLLKALM